MSASAEQQAEETPISSLIDVVFLLIMFFVATANVEQDGFDDTVNLAKSKHMQLLKSKKPEQFPISINSENVVKVNGNPFQPHEMPALTRWAATHQKQFGSERGEVMLRVDGKVELSLVNKVVEAVNAGGLYKVKITSKAEGVQ